MDNVASSVAVGSENKLFLPGPAGGSPRKKKNNVNSSKKTGIPSPGKTLTSHFCWENFLFPSRRSCGQNFPAPVPGFWAGKVKTDFPPETRLLSLRWHGPLPVWPRDKLFGVPFSAPFPPR